MENKLINRYWVDSPKLFEERMKEIVKLYPDKIETFELCKNNLGQSVPGFRMGKGSKHVFLLGREHGHEPVGTCGLTFFMEGLAQGMMPTFHREFSEAEEILERLTLYMFPIMNPDAADRMSRQIKDSFPASVFVYSQEDSDKYKLIHSEPGLTLKHDRPPHYSTEEMEVWRKTGKPIGTLFTEDGVELWMDWNCDKAPQTRAIKRLLNDSNPILFVDIHAWETDTQIIMPDGLNDKDLNRHKRLGNLLYDALDEASLPINSGRHIGTAGGSCSIEWVYETFGAISYLYEIHNGYLWFNPDVKQKNVKLPIVSKEEIILSVWYGIKALIKGVLGEND